MTVAADDSTTKFVQVKITPGTHRRLRLASAEHAISMSTLVVTLIDRHLDDAIDHLTNQ